MKKIILHIGYPKTATTTIQHHLFESLHREGDINFLGKLIVFDKKTKSPSFLKSKSNVFREFIEGKQDNISLEDLDNYLRSDKLNVISDEGLLVYYPGKPNASVNEKIENIRRLTERFDVTVVVSLRNPVDLLFSLYTQLFRQYYKCHPHKGDFGMYLESLHLNSSGVEAEYYNFKNVVEIIGRSFNSRFLLFEDFKNQPDDYYQEWSNILEIQDSTVDKLLSNRHENRREKPNKGYITTKVSLYVFAPLLRRLFKKNQLIYSLLSKVFRSEARIIRRLINWELPFYNDHHCKPSHTQEKEILNLFGMDNRFNADEFGLSVSKLQKYGYYK